MNFNRLIFVFNLVLAFTGLPASAQWQLTIDTFAGRDNNLLRYYYPVNDFVFSPQIEIAWLGAQTKFYYQHDLTRLNENSQYNYTTQKAGLDYIISNKMDISHYFSANFSVRQNAADFTYFDYWKAEGLYNFGYFPNSRTFLRGELALYYKNFHEEAAWNHFETDLNLSGSVSLATRTTVKMSLVGMLRDFSPYTSYDSGAGIKELASLWQLVGIFRIAQSFGEQVGGFSEILFRHNPSESNPYQIEVTAFSPIDDYFGYKGYRWTNSLKWKINPRFWTKIVIATFDNTYLNRPVYAFDFDSGYWLTDASDDYIVLADNRHDRGYTAGFSAGLRLPRLFNRAANLEIIGSVDYVQNNSNDAYFIYDDLSYGLQMRYDFQW